MKVPIKFRVTRKHIEKGVPEEGDSCPIYFALKDALRCTSFDTLHVNNDQIDIDQGYARHTKKTKNFIRAFDAGHKVKPFSDEIILTL